MSASPEHDGGAGLVPTLGRLPLSVNWQYLRAIARGESAIDLRGMALRNREDACRFAREYGLDPDHSGHRAWMQRVQREAVAFLRERLLREDEAAAMPEEIAEPEDVLDLLVFASRFSASRRTRRLWSCALLKVMHALFYIDSDIKLRHIDAIRDQVFAALDTVVRPAAGGGQVLTDGEIALPLLRAERKRAKDRHSILLKLLQKPAYVAEDIYDHLGMRLVLETRIECLLALRVLQRTQLISSINVEAHRVRNTLLDLDAAHEVLTRWRGRLAAAKGYPHALLAAMDAELDRLGSAPSAGSNPHSGSGYRSVQITVRKLIHLDDPAARPGDAGGLGMPGGCFLFNYEIQLLDRAAWEATHTGPASHEAYKQRQIETARRRVLGELIEALASPAE